MWWKPVKDWLKSEDEHAEVWYMCNWLDWSEHEQSSTSSFPEEDKFKHESVFDSPSTSDGNPRMVNDYKPLAQIKQSFSAQKLNTVEEIIDFACRYVVPEMLVRN